MHFDMTGRGSYTRDNLSVTRAPAVPFVAGTSLRSAPINFINPSAFAVCACLTSISLPCLSSVTQTSPRTRNFFLTRFLIGSFKSNIVRAPPRPEIPGSLFALIVT